MILADLPVCPIVSKMKNDADKLRTALIRASETALATVLTSEDRAWHEARVERLS